MIFEISLVVVIFANLAFCWHEMSKQGKELDDLRTKYFIANESIRDLKTRIRFLEKEEARRKRMQSLLEAKNKSYII